MLAALRILHAAWWQLVMNLNRYASRRPHQSLLSTHTGRKFARVISVWCEVAARKSLRRLLAKKASRSPNVRPQVDNLVATGTGLANTPVPPHTTQGTTNHAAFTDAGMTEDGQRHRAAIRTRTSRRQTANHSPRRPRPATSQAARYTSMRKRHASTQVR